MRTNLKTFPLINDFNSEQTYHFTLDVLKWREHFEAELRERYSEYHSIQIKEILGE